MKTMKETKNGVDHYRMFIDGAWIGAGARKERFWKCWNATIGWWSAGCMWKAAWVSWCRTTSA